MKMIAMGSILALATLSAAPLMAQPSPRYNDGAGYNQDTFWRGAPSDTRSRIDFLQKRIDRGVADGSLDREEARRSQAELNNIRRDTVRMRGRMTPNGEALTQRRLDNLAQRIRWERHDGQRAYNDGRGGRDPYSTDYDASRHYRDDPRYQERRLSSNDQVYRGSDGRMYCKRSDGNDRTYHRCGRWRRSWQHHRRGPQPCRRHPDRRRPGRAGRQVDRPEQRRPLPLDRTIPSPASAGEG